MAPVAPVDPAEPVGPVEPVEPVEPVAPAPVAPVDPVGPVEPAEPVGPVEPVNPSPAAYSPIEETVYDEGLPYSWKFRVPPLIVVDPVASNVRVPETVLYKYTVFNNGCDSIWKRVPLRKPPTEVAPAPSTDHYAVPP